MPVLFRALALLAFTILLGGGIVFFIVAGMAGPFDYDWHAGCIAAGMGAMMFSIFALVKATQRYLVSWWSSLIKPVLMIALAEAAFASAVVMGSDPRLRSEEQTICVAVIIFALIFFIVVACISNRTMRAILGESPSRAVQAATPVARTAAISPRGRLWAMLLALVYFAVPFLGGLHRMYVGKVGTGILWMLSLGGFGIGQIVDIIMIASGQFTDKEGRRLLMWTNPNEYQGAPPAVAQNSSQPAPAAASAVPAVRDNGRPFDPGSFILAVLGMLVLLAATTVGFLTAINLPAIVAAGIPDPKLAEEITREFGYKDWPQLLQRIAAYVTVFLFLASCVLLLVARRKSGGTHCLRAVLAPVAIGAGLAALSDATGRISWSTVSELAQADRIGPAIDAALNGIVEEPAMIFAGLLLTALVLLFWPAKRAPVSAPALNGDAVPTQG